MKIRVFSASKTARLAPIFKKDDETECRNYPPVSFLSIPSNILETEINDILVRHIYKDNNLSSNRQWAYRSGYSTEYLLTHLTETWRRTQDSGKVVAAAFIAFKKAFDSVSHATLLKKLRRDWHHKIATGLVKGQMNQKIEIFSFVALPSPNTKKNHPK